MTSMPTATPKRLFHFREGRNEPWVQSWKRMKLRSRKPDAGIATASTSQYETSSSLYITTISAR